MNGLVRSAGGQKGKMQLAVAGAAAAAGASLKRPREASAVAHAEKQRFKVDLDHLECPICSEPFAPPCIRYSQSRRLSSLHSTML